MVRTAVVLPVPGPPVSTVSLVCQRLLDGELLALIQGQPAFIRQVLKHALQVRRLEKGQPALLHVQDRLEPVGHADLAIVKGRQVDSLLLLQQVRRGLIIRHVVGDRFDVNLFLDGQAFDPLAHQI